MLLSVCIVAGFILHDKYGYRKRCFCEGCYMDIDTIVAELTRRFDALRYEVAAELAAELRRTMQGKAVLAARAVRDRYRRGGGGVRFLSRGAAKCRILLCALCRLEGL